MLALDTETLHGKAGLLTWKDGYCRLSSFQDFLEYMVKLPDNRFVFYHIDFDVNALLAHLPERIWAQLHIERFVSYKGIQLRYIKDKYFMVCWKRHVFHFYDLWPFFQKSLDEATLRFNQVNFKQDPKFDWEDSTRIWRYRFKELVDYGVQDARATQELLDGLLSAIEDIGLGKVETLYSPGYIAKLWLKRHDVKFGRCPDGYWDFIARCYHGARVEIFQRGTWKRAWHYDIKSSYPFVMSCLPDFQGVIYTYTKIPHSDWFFARVRVWDKDREFGFFPVKSKGINVFPLLNGREVYATSTEINYYLDHNLGKLEFLEAVELKGEGGRPYKGFIEDLYNRRKESGLKGQCMKLILNSLYGISAEKKREWKKIGVHKAIKVYDYNNAQSEFGMFVHTMAYRCSEAERYWERRCNCAICKDVRMVMKHCPKHDRTVHYLYKEYYHRYVRLGNFSNIALASFVTAGGRVNLYKGLAYAGRDAIACFTDSLYSSRRISQIENGDVIKMGDWEKDKCRPLLMIGSGIYQYGEMSKNRGFHFPKGISLRSLLDDIKDEAMEIIIPQRVLSNGMRRLRSSTNENDEVAYNDFVDNPKHLQLNFDIKRNWAEETNALKLLSMTQRSFPLTF